MNDLERKNHVSIDHQRFSWTDFEESEDFDFSHDNFSQSPIAFIVDDSENALKILVKMYRMKLDGTIILRSRMTDLVHDLLVASRYSVFDSKMQQWAHLAENITNPCRISLLTSGTTGSPKLIHHTWDSINTSGNLRNAESRNWILPYQIGSYAWFQLVTLSMFSENQSLTICDELDFEKIFQLAKVNGADSISATPTFWRMAFLQAQEATLESLVFKQITLGGEIVDQNILNSLRELYPESRITHIYASTEAGASIVVNDGKSGFPESFLTNHERKTSLKIEDGILFIRSRFAGMNVSDESGWVNTRDRVECVSGRVLFKGRADSSIINVGGSKAFPSDIESVIMSHEIVDWCRVRAVSAPFIGQLPQADLKINKTIKFDELEKIMTNFCEERLPEHAVPRVWNLLDKIPISESLKAEL